MPPRSISHAVLSALTLLAVAAPAAAQDAPDARVLQREVADAHEAAVTAALAVQDELAALVPAVPGWTCEVEEEQGDAARMRWTAAVPHVPMTCDHGDRSIFLELVLDAHAVSRYCGRIAAMLQEGREGLPEPDEFQTYQTEDWQLTRDRGSFKGCVAGRVGIWARLRLSWEAVAAGPAATDAFVEALVASDPAPLLAAVEEVGLDAAQARLTDALNAQSLLMAESLPAPPGATRKVVRPDERPLPDGREPSPYETLYISPGAFVTLDWEGCQVWLTLKASPFDLPEGGDVRRWGLPRNAEMPPDYAFFERDSGRLVGWEQADGTSIRALVDGRVAVSATIPDDLPCEDDPGIARRLFEEIVARDLPAFGLL